MNTINRVVCVLLLLGLLLTLTATFILPHVILISVGEVMTSVGYQVGSLPVWLRLLLGVFLSALSALPIGFLIFLEVRPQRQSYVRVQQAAGGMATISTDSITQQLQHKLSAIHGVTKVSSKIQAKGEKVKVVVLVDTRAGLKIPDLASRLNDLVQSTLVNDLGLDVFGQPEIRLRVAASPAKASESNPPSIPVLVPPLPETERGKPKVTVSKSALEPVPPPLPSSESGDWTGRNPEDEEFRRA